MTRRRGPYRVLIDWMIRFLVKEHRGYTRRFPNDLESLVSTLRPGDVILVEGSQRVSEVIKYLTQSSWSHAALYVGDALVKRGGADAEKYRSRFGPASGSMLVESTLEDGVAASPLSKYVNHNIRICRPINLRPGDLATVLDSVISQIGLPYGVEQIIDLARYFFPVRLIPRRLRFTALKHGGRVSKEVICSSQIAMAFQRVRYPIQAEISPKTVNGARRRFAEWNPFTTRRNARVLENGVFTACDPLLVTPRDFDLSPYFEVVKFSRRDFDYKKITWSAPPSPAVERAASAPRVAHAPAFSASKAPL
jgi:hypothetical protein